MFIKGEKEGRGYWWSVDESAQGVKRVRKRGRWPKEAQESPARRAPRTRSTNDE